MTEQYLETNLMIREPDPLVPLSLVASVVGRSVDEIKSMLTRTTAEPSPEYLSIEELAERWRCSRSTVYHRLRAAGASVLDFAPPGKRGRKVVPLGVVMQIEKKHTKRLQ